MLSYSTLPFALLTKLATEKRKIRVVQICKLKRNARRVQVEFAMEALDLGRQA